MEVMKDGQLYRAAPAGVAAIGLAHFNLGRKSVGASPFVRLGTYLAAGERKITSRSNL